MTVHSWADHSRAVEVGIAVVALSDLAVSVAEEGVGRSRRTLPDLCPVVHRSLHPGSTDSAGHRHRCSRLGIHRRRNRCSRRLLGRPQHKGPVGRTGPQEGNLGPEEVDRLEEVDSAGRAAEAPCTGLAGRKPLRRGADRSRLQSSRVGGAFAGNVEFPSQL